VSLGSGICACLNNSANQQYLPEDSSFCTSSPTTNISSIIEESTETPYQNTTKGAESEEDTTDMPVSSYTTPGADSEEEEETTEGAESEEETTQGAESEEETTISPDLKGVCTEEQNMELLDALEAATTSECRTLMAIMNSDNDEEATDAQICDCLSSGHDFSALSGFDCKVGKDDTQNVSVFVSGGGVCSSDSVPAKQVKFSMTVSMTVDTFNAKKEEVKEGIAKSLNVHKDDVEVAVIEAAESRLRRMLSNIELEVTVLTDDEDTIVDTVTGNNFADTLSSNISESTDEDVVATGVSEPIVSINPAAPSPVVTTSESDDEIGGGKWALIVICILTTLAIAAFFTWFCYYQDPKSKAKPELEMGNPSSI